MKTNQTWLAMLAVVAALAAAQPARAITFSEPDGNLHPSVGATTSTWHYEDIGQEGPVRYTGVAAGTLIYKKENPDGSATGLFLTLGQVARDYEASEDYGAANDYRVESFVNFNTDPKNHPEQDIPVVAYHWFTVEPKDWAAWEGVGILVIQANNAEDLPEPAEVVPLGFLDEFTQRQLQESEFVTVGYGPPLLFPPPRLDAPEDWGGRGFFSVKVLEKSSAG